MATKKEITIHDSRSEGGSASPKTAYFTDSGMICVAARRFDGSWFGTSFSTPRGEGGGRRPRSGRQGHSSLNVPGGCPNTLGATKGDVECVVESTNPTDLSFLPLSCCEPKSNRLVIVCHSRTHIALAGFIVGEGPRIQPGLSLFAFRNPQSLGGVRC